MERASCARAPQIPDGGQLSQWRLRRGLRPTGKGDRFMKPAFFGIMACCERHGIGYQGKIQWNCPGDLDHYRKMTAGFPLIMGRKTYLSMPEHALKDRRIVVFSSAVCKIKENCPAQFVRSWNEFIGLGLTHGCMVGGGQISRLFLEKNGLRYFLLTRIHQHDLPADALFPYSLIASWKREILFENPKNYTIYRYENPTYQNTPHRTP